MSVIVSKRNPSRFEPIKHAVDLRHLVDDLVSRNMGIRKFGSLGRRAAQLDIVRDIEAQRCRDIVRTSKQQLLVLTRRIQQFTRAANTIYPRSLQECDTRRYFQNVALVSCEQIISEFQHIVSTFNVDVNVYKQYVEAVVKQITLIKAWRQSDNKMRKRFIQGDI